MSFVKYFIVLLFLAVLTGCDVPSDTGDVDLDYIVIRGYLYTEQDVDDIRLTTPAQIITEPITEDFQTLSQIYYLGEHEVIVYRVNTEYEELYEFQEQDSRFLNDPPSNVTNGVGFFTAFSGTSRDFVVARE